MHTVGHGVAQNSIVILSEVAIREAKGNAVERPPCCSLAAQACQGVPARAMLWKLLSHPF